MRVKKIPYLIQKHRIYHFRIRVPKQLKDHPSFESKEFIYKSLNTDSLSQAIKLRDHELARISALANNEDTSLPAITYDETLTIKALSQSTLQEALELTLKTQKSKVSTSTLNGYKNAVRGLLKRFGNSDITMSKITVKEVCMHVEKLKETLTEKTINNHLNYLSTIFKIAKRHGMAAGENPFTNFGLSNAATNPRQPYSRSQVQAIYKALPSKYKLAWKILYYTGMRRSELFKLKHESIVKLEAEQEFIYCISVAPNGDGKTSNATRYIPIHPDLKDDLKGFSGFDYSPNTFGSYRKKTVESLFGKQFAKTHDTHSLRHTFSTTLHNHFPDQPQLVDWLTGHSRTIKSESFQTYFHGYGLDRLYKAIKAIPKIC